MRISGRALCFALVTAAACNGGSGPAQGLVGDGSVAASGTPYHLPQGVDAINLLIDEERATFSWGISGCDFFGGDNGKALIGANRTTLVPRDGSASFRWVDGRSFGNNASSLVLTVGIGERELLITGEVDGTQIQQTWIAGGVCVTCGGDLGPTGQEPCSDPYVGLDQF